MGKIIQFPRHQPDKKWGPTEILAIKDPHDVRLEMRKERSRIATTQKIADSAGDRATKRAKRKQLIVEILANGQPWTIAVLMRLVGDRTGQPVSRATVAKILKDLQTEGLVKRAGVLWSSTASTVQRMVDSLEQKHEW